MPVPFNTHEVIQALQDLGFPTAQAEGLTAVLLRTAQASQDHLATKLDLAEVKADLKADIQALRFQMEQHNVELRLQMEQRAGEVEQRFAEVRVDAAQLRGEMRVLVWQSRLTLGGIVGLVLYALKQAFGF